jgi:DNA-binding MarR family transcriptional regulator
METSYTAEQLRAFQGDGKISIARLMLPLYRAFNALAQEKYAEHGHAGLTTAHTLLLAHIDWDGSRIVALAERMGTTKQFTGRLVHQLEDKNYVSTEADPADRRAAIVKITPQGLQFLADACAIKTEIEAIFKSMIGEDELAPFMTTLTKLSSAVSQYIKPGGDIDGDEV